MALNKGILKGQILALMTEMRMREQVADEEFADRLATAIDAFVRSGTVQATGVGNQGAPVQSTGAIT